MNSSYLEKITEALIKDANLPVPIKEFKFCATRKWKCDFLFLEKKLILEVEGGVWNGGRHTSGLGFIADCEKYNEATLMGFKVLRVTKEHIENGKMIEWLKRALNGEPVLQETSGS